ncbi:MAG: DNA modification methylase [Acetobacteraceae bacterium]
MANLSSARTAIAQTALTVTSTRLDELRPSDRLLRRHSKRHIKQLARSIETFRFNVPILIDRDGNIIAGQGRFLACRELGWTEIPTIRVGHLNEAQLKAFMIADNRLSELSTWDDQILGETLQELSLLNLDFSLEATGFDTGEIDFRIEASKAPRLRTDRSDEIPDGPPGPPVSVLGDLWQLDRHRVLCGSALEIGSYETLMAGHQAEMVFTDPPYNVPISGHVSGLGAVQHREFAMACGEMSTAEFTGFLNKAMGLLAQHSRDGSLHMMCMDWRHMPEVLEAARPVYSELKNLCVWAKDNAGMGSLYRSQHELVFVYKRGTAKHTNNVELGRHGRHRTNIWQYPGVNSFGRKGEEGNLLAMHPTVKPVKLVADAILDCTSRGDIVLDGFLGSGSTLIAAERVGRRCFGLELDPLYVDTILRRWQVLTGGTARHAVTGAAFNDTPVTPSNGKPHAPDPDEHSGSREPAVRKACRKGGVR